MFKKMKLFLLRRKMSCGICCTIVNKRNKEVECGHCAFRACTNCCKKYILGILNDAKCMSCGKGWNIDFLVSNFSYAFINGEYKKHREDTLFDRQLSMMEETQKVIERRKEVDALEGEIAKYLVIVDNAKEEIRKLKQKKWNMQFHRVAEVVDRFYGHCPYPNCRGFLTASSKCGICDKKACLTCKEPYEEAHECNPQIVESIQNIRKDSKPCPKCKCMIHRIEGCRQMWCVMCHTTFDWNTSEVVTSGPLHNPHYVEWQRRNGMTNANERCNDNFEYIQPYHIERTLRCDNAQKTFIIEFLRCLYHVYDIDLYDFRSNRMVDDEKYLRLRIDYLEQRISRDEFKNKLQQQEKKENKKMEIAMVFDMFHNTGRVLVSETLRHNGKLRTSIGTEEITTVNGRINELIRYTNESLNAIGKKYKNKVPNVVIKDDKIRVKRGIN